MEAELHILGSPGRDEMRKWTYTLFGRPGKTSAEDERALSKSWPSGSTKSGTLDLWQSKQSRIAEAEPHIFGRPGRDEMDLPRDEMRKWTYPYLEVLAEQVRKMNEIFEVLAERKLWKAELQIFGSKDPPELRKQSLRPLKVLAERKCGS